MKANSIKEDLFGVCPYFTTQKLLSGKWSIYIIYLLSEETLRFNELQRRMPENITHTSLTRQLRALEKEGLILRKDYKLVPPHVEYSLTELGENFKPVMNELKKWGLIYISNLNNLKS